MSRTFLAISLLTLVTAANPDTQAQQRASPDEYNRLRIFSQTALSGPKVGDPAPDFELRLLGEQKQTLKLSDVTTNGKPTVLVFGSLTCGPFCQKVPGVEKTHQAYKNEANFVFIYIRDAHPSDHAGGRVAERPSARSRPGGRRANAPNAAIAQPKTEAERHAAAQRVVKQQGITFPTVVDDMKDTAAWTYAAFPDRLYLIDGAGKIIYKSRPGPQGFLLDEMRSALEDLLAKAVTPPEVSSDAEFKK